MSDTRTALADEATSLIRTRGYSAFSYADLASAVGIRKASVHHHFPTKEDLGVEVVKAYVEDFERKLDLIAARDGDLLSNLADYAALFRVGLCEGKVCLCGALAAEADAVPQSVRAANARFFASNLNWLTEILERAAREGELRADADPAHAARGILACLEGSLLVARAMHDVAIFDEATTALFDGLRPAVPA
jgi:TetR/AcrR family transcriptional regulator, transcriptional repressor for nem operon